MTNKRTRQSVRRQPKELEIPRIEAAILNALGRDLAQFFEEQRQQTSRELIDRAVALDAVSEEHNTCSAGGGSANHARKFVRVD